MLQHTERPFPVANELALPPAGFGEFEVAEMPAYVQGYSKRGNEFDGQTTAVHQQARFGNKRGVGGMEAYLSQAEDDTFLEGYKQKKGNMGVYDWTRWGPGQDWRGGFGVASLSGIQNYAGIPTRGGQLRKGGPKRSDVVDRPDYWFETARPGISNSRYTQKNDNYAGLFEFKRQTPVVELDNDMLVLREMIQSNPYHINSHAAKQAEQVYEKEFGDVRDQQLPAYYDNLHGAIMPAHEEPMRW